MLSVLAHHAYRRLLAAQVVALLGTGLLTVALGLLAYDLAGEAAGAVLGTALAIKMVAYVVVAPVAQAFAERLPRRGLLVTLDLVRAAIALGLPFVTEIWQVYALILALQSASAAFTPAFQATIPDLLPDERDYTRALSLSRLAYDLESLVSPMLAAAFLTVVSFHDLFAGTVAGFLVSAALVARVALPAARPADRKAGPRRSIWDRTTRGVRLYLAVPRLRGLLALNLAAAAGGAMVIVNTVVLVKGMAFGEREVALALAAFGGGSMLAALGLPRLLERWGDRPAMLGGAGLLTAGLAAGAAAPGYGALLALWAVVGLGYSAILTPSGRLLRRSSGAEDRPALFAAQFALSHAGWLVAYPLAGQLGARIGMGATAVAMAALAASAILLAVRLWPAGAEAPLPHDHSDLPPDHPHLREHGVGPRHAHPPLADPLHPGWASLA